MAQRKIVMDGSPECATTITALGRVNLLDIYYNVLVRHLTTITELTPNPQVKILYIDTDCLVLYIRIHEKDYNRIMKEKNVEQFFDFSNLPKNHILYCSGKEAQIGILKYEIEDARIVKQFIALCGKCYTISYFDNDSITNKCKGVPTAISKNFTTENYIQGLIYPNIQVSGVKLSQRARYRYIGVNSNMRETYTYEVRKLVLNSMDTKRYIIDNGMDSLPLGHFKTLPGERCRYKLRNNVVNKL